MKHLDSIFIRPNQIVCGEELESDRYFITIEEEKRQVEPLSCLSKASAPSDVSANLVSETRHPLHTSQSAKRKRKGFRPPQFIRDSSENVCQSGGDLPLKKKQRVQETETEPSPNRLKQKTFSQKEFLHLFSQHGNQSDDSHSYDSTLSDAGTACRSSSKFFHGQQQDQTVPVISAFKSSDVHAGAPSSSVNNDSHRMDKVENQIFEKVQKSTASDTKRNPSQMFALFCGKNRTSPSRKMKTRQDSDKLFSKYGSYIGKDVSRSEETNFKVCKKFENTLCDTSVIGDIGNFKGPYGKNQELPSKNQMSSPDAKCSLRKLSEECQKLEAKEVSPILSPDSFLSEQSQQGVPDLEQSQTEVVEIDERENILKENEDVAMENLSGTLFVHKDDSCFHSIAKDSMAVKACTNEEGKLHRETKDTETCISFEADSESISPYLGESVLSRNISYSSDFEMGTCDMIHSSGLSENDRKQADVENDQVKGHFTKMEQNLDVEHHNCKPYPYSKPGPHSGHQYLSGSLKRHPSTAIGCSSSTHPGSLFEYPALARQRREGNPVSSVLDTVGQLPRQDPRLSSVSGKDSGKVESEVNLGLMQSTLYPNLHTGLSPEFFPLGSSRNYPLKMDEFTGKITQHKRGVKVTKDHAWKGSVISDTVIRDNLSSTTFHQNGSVVNEFPQEQIWIDSVGHRPLQCLDDGVLNTKENWDYKISQEGKEMKCVTQWEEQCPQTVPQSRMFEGGSPWNGPCKENLVPTSIKRTSQSIRTPIITRPPGDDIQISSSRKKPSSCSLSRYSGDEHFSERSLSSPYNDTAFNRSSDPHSEADITSIHSSFDKSLVQETCQTSSNRMQVPVSTFPGLSRPRCISQSSRGKSSVRVGLSKRLTNTRHSENNLRRPEVNVSLKSKGFEPPLSKISGQSATVGQREMGGELFFPSLKDCGGNVTPNRQVTIPTEFENVFQYRQVFKTALREHLNIILFELAQSFHSAMEKVDVSGFSTYSQDTKEITKPEQCLPSCPHGRARMRAVKKAGANKGRLFYCCPGSGQSQCRFFKWVDEYQGSQSKINSPGNAHFVKPILTTADEITVFFRSHNTSLYCGCTLTRCQAERFGKQKGSYRNSRNQRNNIQVCGEKKGLYLELSRKEKSSSYSKDDIWIISKGLSFDYHSTFIAKSVYYGPSSSGQVEIAPLSGYSPSNWHSGETVHALLACNAGSELTCITNLEEHVKAQTMPLLPHILHSKEKRLEDEERRVSRGINSFVPPAQSTVVTHVGLAQGVVMELANNIIDEYHLNEDQASALKLCSSMFTVEGNSTAACPVTLIHGVFGAGKSFLLAVVVLFLVKVFDLADSSRPSDCTSPQKAWKILISSTTNVAVDRILQGLLDLGFEDFVRVGSMRKIAKPVLPYSVHSTGSESQELKELQDMLKGDLTPSEKTLVRKSIERHKLGENKKKLNQVRVVGVTCAACVFPCMDHLKFPVLLLDECSQMTEPASLIPLARFECQKLVLVGDPKQLSPTIQGSKPQHEAGLEQTLFDRLMKMGHDPVMLRTQYRCHPRISAIANRLFYDNKLLDGIAEENRRPLEETLPTLCFYNVAKGKEKAGSDGSYYNEQEAKFVVFLIQCLLDSGIHPLQIGVITLYKSQLRQVSQSLSETKACSQTELKTIQISTVDAFQGGEKDVIILSCVRTEHVGFIDCNRRTNVALTRAKRHLFIVGNLQMLSGNEVWGRVISYCREVPGGIISSQVFMENWPKKETPPDKRAQKKSKNSSGRRKRICRRDNKQNQGNTAKDTTESFTKQSSNRVNGSQQPHDDGDDDDGGENNDHFSDECDITDELVHDESLSNYLDNEPANDIDSKIGDDRIHFCDDNHVKDHDCEICVDDISQRHLRDDDATKVFRCHGDNNLCDDESVVEGETRDAHSVNLSHILDSDDIYLDDDNLCHDDLTVDNDNSVECVDIGNPITVQVADVIDNDIKDNVNTDRCVAICSVESSYDHRSVESRDDPVDSINPTDSHMDVPNQASCPTKTKEVVVPRNFQIKSYDSDEEELPVFDIMSLKPF